MKQFLKYAAAIVTFLGGTGLLFTVFCNQSLKNERKTYDTDQMENIPSVDTVIVPGCLVHENGKPSFALEDRLNTALDLYQSRKTNLIILSGAARENRAGRKFLINAKVDSKHIIMDDGGLDTYSTVYRCREAFPKKQFLVCTQKKYFKRTGYLMQQLGMNGFCVRADRHSYKKELYEKFRDFFAADKAWIECTITKPKPKYSLKELPITY